MTGDMLHHALEYVARGWLVFPLHTPTGDGCSCRYKDCPNVGKHPRVPSAHPQGDPLRGRCHGECGRDGHGLHDATTDADRVKAWWSKWPNANIGGRTGVAFDVLDIDHADLEEGTADWPAVQMPGGTVATTGNGWHFYVAPGASGNRTRFTDHCDWRGDGGYVVLPPSLHYSGRHYEWFAPATLELHPAPAALCRLLNPPSEPPSTTPRNVRPVRPSGGGGGNGLAGIYGKVATATEGTRNATLWWAARAVALKVYRRELADHEGRTACDTLHSLGVQVGLADFEVRRTIESGWRTGIRGVEGQVGA